MATALPGPLYSRISGRIGGTVHRADPRAQVIAAPGYPRRRASDRQRDMRLALGAAATAWRTLSDSDRAAWTQYAASLDRPSHYGGSRTVSPFQAYSQASALAAPFSLAPAAPPFVPGIRPAVAPLEYSDAEGLWLAGYSRALAADESAIWRVRQVTPATVAAPSPRIAQAYATNGSQGLGPYTARAWRKTIATEYLTRAGGVSAATSHTVELWLRANTGQANGRALWRSDSALINGNFDGAADTLSFRSGGVTTALGPYPDDGQWHHVAFTMSAAALLAIGYIDGVALPTTPAYTPGAFSTNFWLTVASALGTSTLLGSIAHFVLWDSVRTPAQILAAYNAGRGQFLDDTSGARVILNLSDDNAGVSPDTSGNALDFQIVGGSYTRSPFARALVDAPSSYPSGNSWIDASPFLPSQPFSRPTTTRFEAP